MTEYRQAATAFNLPDLPITLHEYFFHVDGAPSHTMSGVHSHEVSNLPSEHIQIWYKIYVQQIYYHTKMTYHRHCKPFFLSSTMVMVYMTLLLPTLHQRAPGQKKYWMISFYNGCFNCCSNINACRPLNCATTNGILSSLLRLISCIHIALQCHPSMGTSHLSWHQYAFLQYAVQPDGTHTSNIIPVTLIHLFAHLIPNFSDAAHNCLMHKNYNELWTEFWLNKYWWKESFYSLHKCDM